MQHCQVAIKNNNLQFLLLTRKDILFFSPFPLLPPPFGSTHPNRCVPVLFNQQFLLAN